MFACIFYSLLYPNINFVCIYILKYKGINQDTCQVVLIYNYSLKKTNRINMPVQDQHSLFQKILALNTCVFI